ncbi:MAG: hypothetical protein JXN65_06730 [Clostridia bacterium]|nr:hypothetical protein [Clostridia bacterium]
MQYEYKKIYETYKSTGKTVKLDREIWEDIKKYLAVNYKEQEIKIDLADGSRKKLSDMNEAYELIIDYQEDIKRIEINARKEEALSQFLYVNIKESFDNTLYISLETSDLSEKKANKRFIKSVFRKSSIFPAGTGLAVIVFLLALVFFANKIFMLLRRDDAIDRFVFMVILLGGNLLITKFKDKTEYKNGVQFWVDKYSIADYERQNKKIKIKTCLYPVIALIVIMALILIF